MNIFFTMRKTSMKPGMAHRANSTALSVKLIDGCVMLLVVCVVAVSSGGQWSGRTCCELPLSTQCKNSCRRAKSRDALGPQCRISDEMAFFNCIERQEVSAECCGMSTSSQCTAVCRAIFIQDSPPTDSQRHMVTEMCSPPVAACVHNFTTSSPSRSPIESLPCCNHSASEECRSRCRQALRTLTSEEEIVEEVVTHCGLPDPTEPLWQCFLRSSTNNVRDNFNQGGRIDVTGIDGAKLQCCKKAVTSSCRNLCFKTFSRGWTSNVNFHEQCSYHRHELDLNMCLEEVAEPCKLGCSGLSFCSNFNYRPTEMFRSCTVEADNMAETAMRIWSEGTISLPVLMNYDIPVRDLNRCQPQVWKSIACTLEIKPCHQQVRATWICKSDCLALLRMCLDVPRLQEGMSAESICNKLSPHDDSLPCISLSRYLVESPNQGSHLEVNNPCTPNPCSENEICILNRRQCKADHKCKDFLCKPGCPMGEVLTHLVPHNSFVQLPMVTSRQLNCYRVCKCGHHNLLHRCRDMACVEESHCLLRAGMEQDHDTKFQLDCNTCVCHGGQVVCTKRQCHTISSQTFTGLPCNCPSNYVPVCGHNGRTYPSACLARCLGLTDVHFEYGRCGSKDPCVSNPCAVGEKCIVKNQVCLSSRMNNCRQYECIRLGLEGCSRNQHSPVCDVDHVEIPSMCLLITNGLMLAYRGFCMDGCSRVGVVCGTNGETYRSECVAWSDGVLIDYMGPCLAVGQLPNVHAFESLCYNVVCPPLTRWPHCQLITPPGACCGTCAGEIRVLYSQSQADRASHVTNNDPMTVKDVRQVLQQQISVKECDVFVYISIEDDLVILVAPIVAQATALQVEACMVETQKIGSLINTNSPTLMSHLAMGPFLSADIRTSKVIVVARSSTSSISSHSFLTWHMMVIVLCHVFIEMQWVQA